MGVWTREYTEDDIWELGQWPPNINLRPDVMLEGDIIRDKSYGITVYSKDGVMEIRINKKRKGGK